MDIDCIYRHIQTINLTCKQGEYLVFVCLILALMLFVFIYSDQYLYRREILINVELSGIIILINYILYKLNDTLNLYNILCNIGTRYSIVSCIILFLFYLLNKFVCYRISSNLDCEIRFLKYEVNLLYVILFIFPYDNLFNRILIITWIILLNSIIFHIKRISNDNVSKENEKIEIYKTRLNQIEAVKDIIFSEKHEVNAISIEGEWGSGKSKFINTLVYDLEKDNNYCIYIKPLMISKYDILIKEFENQLTLLMRENGIYAGKGSSIQNYCNAVLKMIKINSSATLLDFFKKDSIEGESTYNLKKNLQKDIDKLLNKSNKRLIVVIDDFDRVDADYQKDILSFIKEIIDFKNCVTLIAIDYNKLKGEIINDEYLEKFISERIKLVDVDINEIVKVQIDFILKEEMYNNITKKILNSIKENIYNILTKISSLNNKEYLKKNIKEFSKKSNEEQEKFIKESSDIFEKMNNSRRVIHMLTEIRDILILYNKLCNKDNFINEYYSKVRFDKTIVYMSFLKIACPDKYDEIIKHKGIKEYLADESINSYYIKIIMQDITNDLAGNYISEEDALVNSNTYKFIKEFFVNYDFSINNIELMTDTNKKIQEIDSENINIDKDYEEKLSIYNSCIYKVEDSSEKRKSRVKKMIAVLEEYNNQKVIDIGFILNLAVSDCTVYNVEYSIYYLRAVEKVLKTMEYIDNKLVTDIDVALLNIEENVCVMYRNACELLITILIFCMNGSKVNEKIMEMINNIQAELKFGEMLKFNKIVDNSKEYIKNKKLLSLEEDKCNLKDLFMEVIAKIGEYNLELIDKKIIINKVKEFIVIWETWSNIKKLTGSLTIGTPTTVLSNTEIKNELLKYNETFNTVEDKHNYYEIVRNIIIRNIEIDECSKHIIKNICEKISNESQTLDYSAIRILMDSEKAINIAND